jgi:two-component system sensor histidine kinase AgrC
MKIYEFSRILGILLDNAIEAARECEEKMVRVEIRKDSIQNRQILVIENTYLDEKVDFEHMFEKGVSSKKHNTGLGLWEVNKILKKYPNVNLNTSYNGHFFTQQLEMYEDVPSQKEILVP